MPATVKRIDGSGETRGTDGAIWWLFFSK
jgi:hypothetical protein